MAALAADNPDMPLYEFARHFRGAQSNKSKVLTDATGAKKLGDLDIPRGDALVLQQALRGCVKKPALPKHLGILGET